MLLIFKEVLYVATTTYEPNNWIDAILARGPPSGEGKIKKETKYLPLRVQSYETNLSLGFLTYTEESKFCVLKSDHNVYHFLLS